VTPSSLALKRARAYSPLLAALVVTGMVLSFLVVGTLGYLNASSTAGVRGMLSLSPPTEAAIQVQTGLGTNPAAQTAATGALFDDVFAGTPVRAYRSLRTDPLSLRHEGRQLAGGAGTDPQIVLESDPALASRSVLVDGAWPGKATVQDDGVAPATLQAKAAEVLGIRVGDELTIGTGAQAQRIVVVATWLPLDPADPSWFGDPAVASGSDGEAHGPLMVAEDVLVRAPAEPSVRWTLVPDSARITPAELPKLATAVIVLEGRAEHSSLNAGSASVVGDLNATLARAQEGLDAARSITAVQLIIVTVIGLITLGSLASLLGGLRRPETTLLVGRGGTMPRLVGAAAVEAAILLIPGSLLGAAAAIVGLGAAGFTVAGENDWRLAWWAGLAVATTSVALCAAVAWRTAASVTVRRRAGTARQGAARGQSALVGLSILVVIVAAVALWQFRIHSVVGPDQPVTALAAIAPALCLLGLSLLALLGAGPALSAVQSIAARARGISPVLPTRQVARNTAIFGVAVLTITLSVGGATLAAGFAGTWGKTETLSTQFHNGSDVRVRLDTQQAVGDPGSLITAVPYAAIPSVSAAAPVLTAPVRIGSDDVILTAIAAHSIPRVMSSPGSEFDTHRVSSMLSSTAPGHPLPRGASTVTTRLSATAPISESPGVVDAFLWLADDDGALTRLPLGQTPLSTLLSSGTELTAPLPAGTGQWHVLATEASLSGSQTTSAFTVSFDGITTNGDTTGPAPTKVDVAWNHATGTAMIAQSGAVLAIPAVLTDALAARLNITTGDPLSFFLPTTGQTMAATVVGTTELLPGSAGMLGMIVDLPTLDSRMVEDGGNAAQLGDVWIATETPNEVATVAETMGRTSARITTAASGSTSALVAPAVLALWWGMGGALLLGIIAILSITVTLSEQRCDEITVLRTLGMSRRGQMRNRLAELGAVTAVALASGILSGCLVTILTASDLARTATDVPLGLPIAPHFDVGPWLALLGVLVAGLLAVGAGYGARIGRLATEPVLRGRDR
jgi:hypothetical protein